MIIENNVASRALNKEEAVFTICGAKERISGVLYFEQNKYFYLISNTRLHYTLVIEMLL